MDWCRQYSQFSHFEISMLEILTYSMTMETLLKMLRTISRDREHVCLFCTDVWREYNAPSGAFKIWNPIFYNHFWLFYGIITCVQCCHFLRKFWHTSLKSCMVEYWIYLCKSTCQLICMLAWFIMLFIAMLPVELASLIAHLMPLLSMLRNNL